MRELYLSLIHRLSLRSDPILKLDSKISYKSANRVKSNKTHRPIRRLDPHFDLLRECAVGYRDNYCIYITLLVVTEYIRNSVLARELA